MCACVYTNSVAFLSRDDVLAYAMQNINDNSDYDIAVAKQQQQRRRRLPLLCNKKRILSD